MNFGIISSVVLFVAGFYILASSDADFGTFLLAFACLAFGVVLLGSATKKRRRMEAHRQVGGRRNPANPANQRSDGGGDGHADPDASDGASGDGD